MRRIGVLLILIAIGAAVIYGASSDYWNRYVALNGDFIETPQDWFQPSAVVKGGAPADLPFADPSEWTIRPEAIKSATQYARDENSDVLLIVRNDKIEAEIYWNGADRSTLFNAQEIGGVIGALMVGAAISDKLIASSDVALEDIHQAWAQYPAGRLKLVDILQSASGLEQFAETATPWSERMRYRLSSDFESELLARELIDFPGRAFDHGDVPIGLLSAVVHRAAKAPVADYLEKSLWGPLSFADGRVYLDRDDGLPLLASGLFARALDLAGIGVLIANGGQWRGKTVIPKAWIKKMIAPSPNAPFFGYQVWLQDGYINEQAGGSPSVGFSQFSASAPYLANDMVILLGAGGQRVWISPSLKLVVARFGARVSDGWDETRLPNLIISGLESKEPPRPQAQESPSITDETGPESSEPPL
jgi:CubicO group peptidase (beta-lactamase class C family)